MLTVHPPLPQPRLYTPSFLAPLPPPPHPSALPAVPTSWNGLEAILPALIADFRIPRNLAVEFGCWHGYSTAALANNFTRVIGVDRFIGDKLSGMEDVPMVAATCATLAPWPNITLVESGFFEFDCPDADLIHTDIIHTYQHTFACGILAAKHARVLLFHDTESFPEVRQAVSDLAEVTGCEFWNFPYYHGLGILVRQDKKVELYGE